MLDKTKNFSITNIVGDINNSTDTINVVNGSKLPDTPCNLVIWNGEAYSNPSLDPNKEIVRATNITGNVVKVLRGQEGTIAVSHIDNSSIANTITSKMIEDIEDELGDRIKKPTEAEENSIAVFNDDKNIKVSKAKIEEDGSILLPNDKYLKGKNYAGTEYVNIIKVNTDNEAEVGVTMNTGTIEVEEDAGAVTIIDMGVTSASADGTEMSYVVKIDGNNLLKIYTESDGAGGVDTFKVQLLNKAVLTMEDSAGTTHTYTSDTDGSLIIS